MGKFELSAYGVEEMNEQEMLYINGGVILTTSLVIGIIGLIIGVIGAVAGVVSAYCSWEISNPNPNPGDTSQVLLTGYNPTADTMDITISGGANARLRLLPGQSGTVSVSVTQPL